MHRVLVRVGACWIPFPVAAWLSTANADNAGEAPCRVNRGPFLMRDHRWSPLFSSCSCLVMRGQLIKSRKLRKLRKLMVPGDHVCGTQDMCMDEH